MPITCHRLKIYFTFSQFPFVIFRLKKKLNLLVFAQQNSCFPGVVKNHVHVKKHRLTLMFFLPTYLSQKRLYYKANEDSAPFSYKALSKDLKEALGILYS